MNLDQDIRKFLSFANKTSAHYKIEPVGPYALKFTPSLLHSPMTVGLLALVHGNETVGLPILNQILEALTRGEIHVDYPVYFALGNVEAAQANVRFLEEDLNRCFGLKTTASLESKRARELETTVLDHCDYVIDLHQTQRASLKPFFIFQYKNSRCLSILKQLNPGLATVLQTNPIGENTGLSTDEYVRSRGGFGTALELGEKGDNQYSELGLEICRNSLFSLRPLKDFETESNFKLELPLYLLNGSFKALDSSYQLHESSMNFKEFKKGQVIGQSQAGDVLAPENGIMLFPRLQNVTAGCDLFHFCTPISPRIIPEAPYPTNPSDQKGPEQALLLS